ncbi:M16 family metallopeptidase [Pseudomonas botevensis]|uniref:M16 family metallopeptidase n=1 Tax=Pseudomonas botevensis TaxID=2842352 RepID=UPI001C3E48D1|nr:pitrilysin family protein [Pseudomonas botevensis]MBV4473020.1 insulinase family protein [Pseudomonas botevensis]
MNKCLHDPRIALFSLVLITCLSAEPATADHALTAPAGFPAPRLQSLREAQGIRPTPRPLTIKGWKTRSGTKILFIRTTQAPMFDVHVSFAAGSTRDVTSPSLAGVTFSLLNEGVAGKADYTAISETFDGVGARLGMKLDQERASYSLRSLSDPEKSAPALQLFTRILGQPSLSADGLIRVKNELRGRLLTTARQPEIIAALRLQALLVPETPFAHSIYGTQASLDLITRQAVQDFHRQAYSARHAQITLVGDLTLEQAQAISRQIADALPDTPASPALASAKPTGTVKESHVEREQEQTYLLLGQPAVSRQHQDYPALYAATLMFGNGNNSRLINELRQKRGLVYGAKARTEDWAQSGMTTISLHTSPQFTRETAALVRSMFSDYLRDGPTQAELDHLKRRLANTSVVDSASNQQILERLVQINRHELPLDLDYFMEQVQRLTLKQIKAALDRHWSDEQWRVISVGPTVEQLPLPQPVDAPVINPSGQTCRADTGFVAS